MSIVTQRLLRKTASNNYDTIHLEGDSGIILRPDGSSVENALVTLDNKIERYHAKRYGYRVKISESDPDTRVEYLYDAVGMTPAGLNAYNGFEYGSWKDVWFIKNNYPCMVKYDGTEDYRLDPDDYALKEDGTTSDVSNADYGGNAMSALPTVWYKRYTEEDYYYFECSEVQLDDSFYADVHTKSDGTIGAYDYSAMFNGSLINGRLRSLAGKEVESYESIENELNYAGANGSKWTILKWNRWCLIGDLLCLISKSCNGQKSFGNGICGLPFSYDTVDKYRTGTLGYTTNGESLSSSTLYDGQFFGNRGTRYYAMRVFHQENHWGFRYNRCVGLILNNGTPKVLMNRTNNAEYNITGAGYTTVDVAVQLVAGYQKPVISNRYGNFPTDDGGSETTYECDYWILRTSGIIIPILGGAFFDDGQCGPRAVYCNDPGDLPHIGTSLALKDPI